MHRIQQIGFANAIAAGDAYDPFRKLKRSRVVIFELKKRYVIKAQQTMQDKDERVSIFGANMPVLTFQGTHFKFALNPLSLHLKF